MSYKKIELYGGAITVELPAGYGDARFAFCSSASAIISLTGYSQIREVPDHQELYLDENGYSGVIFEILEYVEKPTDAEALQYHFADLVDGTGDETNMLEQSNATMLQIE